MLGILGGWVVVVIQGPRLTSISKWVGEPDYVISSCLQLQIRATGVRVYVTTTGVTSSNNSWTLSVIGNSAFGQ